MRLIVVLLFPALIAACSGGGDSHRHRKASWSVDAPGRSHGVAVTSDGEIVWSVGASKGAFAKTGGLIILAPDGTVQEEIPIELPPCEACTESSFEPSGALVTDEAVWITDGPNVFRVDRATWTPTAIEIRSKWPPDFADFATAALAPDGGQAFLPGGQLSSVALEDPLREERLPFGRAVRGIVSLGNDEYLLNLTEPQSAAGRLTLWNRRTNEVESFDLPRPVAAIAAADGWAIAAVERALGEYELVELDRSKGTRKTLSTFHAPPGQRLYLALVPRERLVIAGSDGSPKVRRDPSILVGSTVLVHADQGPIALLDTGIVTGIALSPDGRTVYVADAKGLKAFVVE